MRYYLLGLFVVSLGLSGCGGSTALDERASLEIEQENLISDVSKVKELNISLINKNQERLSAQERD